MAQYALGCGIKCGVLGRLGGGGGFIVRAELRPTPAASCTNVPRTVRVGTHNYYTVALAPRGSVDFVCPFCPYSICSDI